jgi:hypothetical protein
MPISMDEGMTVVFRASDPAISRASSAGEKIKFAPDLVEWPV